MTKINKQKSIYEMNREELLEYSNKLEDRIERWSHRDWLATQVYIVELRQVDEILLEMYANDTIEKSA